jgi:hypothetical protein
MSHSHIHEYAVDHGPDHEPVPNDISFAARVAILAEVNADHDVFAQIPESKSFFEWNDYILDICTGLANGEDIALNDSQVEMVLDAWVDFTHMLDIDHHTPFDSLAECLSAAPQ